MRTNWILRLAILFAVPAVIAAGDGLIRGTGGAEAPPSPKVDVSPDPGDTNQTAVTSDDPAAPQPETAAHPTDISDIQVMIDHYNNGTAFFVDARPPEEYTESHIPGAYSIPFEAFLKGRPDALDLLPPDLPIIIYCAGGDCDASHKVQKMLMNYGYSDLYVFLPGYPAWFEAGLATEQGAPIF